MLPYNPTSSLIVETFIYVNECQIVQILLISYGHHNYKLKY